MVLHQPTGHARHSSFSWYQRFAQSVPSPFRVYAPLLMTLHNSGGKANCSFVWPPTKQSLQKNRIVLARLAEESYWAELESLRLTDIERILACRHYQESIHQALYGWAPSHQNRDGIISRYSNYKCNAVLHLIQFLHYFASNTRYASQIAHVLTRH